MSFLCKQISTDRWGIYSGTRLLATVSDRATCDAIMSSFENGRTSVPVDSQNTSARLQKKTSNVSVKTVTEALSTPVETSDFIQTASSGASLSVEQPMAKPISTMSDDDLAKVLNVKSVKVKELESAVLRAQMSQRG